MYNQLRYADVVKLADTPDLGSGASGVQVQVLSSAPMLIMASRIPVLDTCLLQSANRKKSTAHAVCGKVSEKPLFAYRSSRVYLNSINQSLRWLVFIVPNSQRNN